MNLKEVIVLTASYYNVVIKPEVLMMYADDLSDLPEQEVIQAYQTYRRNPKNRTMPLPAMIRDIVSPEIDSDTFAISTAARVLEAVSKYGWSNSQDAKTYIGELGWAGVNRFGGWQNVCENLGRNIQTGQFQAQLREILKSEIKVKAAGGYEALEYNSREQIQGSQDVSNLISIMSNGKAIK